VQFMRPNKRHKRFEIRNAARQSGAS
jgi:hypothetical protein